MFVHINPIYYLCIEPWFTMSNCKTYHNIPAETKYSTNLHSQ
ncbi:hypothetical protein SAMN05444288_0372 [Hoylesella oralis]|nr:hypothetical protein SAMN05444288_0372 [Hoylesella oralis]